MQNRGIWYTGVMYTHVLQAKSRRHSAWRFLFLLVPVVGYFLFLAYQHGLRDGVLVTILTWSFFVLCTPLADAGFLLDFPVRVFLGVRMAFAEVVVWALAITLSLMMLWLDPALYQVTTLTKLFHTILTTPYPYWAIIGLAMSGTFLSLAFGDALVDMWQKRHIHGWSRHLWGGLTLVVIFVSIIVYLYYRLLDVLHISF